VSDIDWSKAPEGATQYVVGSIRPWEKIVAGRRSFFDDDAWFRMSNRDDSEDADIIQRPAAWNGTGLPPVGTVCEMHHECWQPANWPEVTIKYASAEYFITQDSAGEQHWHARGVQFRPIRTPEQIAADERRLVIEDMVKALGMETPRTAEYIRCGLIYDAGYRKP
jgi:hypothetical protein